MRVLKKLLLSLIILVVLLAGIGLLLPRRVHVEQSANIEATPATVFALVNDFAMFNRWSPWHAMDPQAEYTLEGPPRGVGARMIWKGDPKTVGSGSQEIVESRPNETVKTHLDFGEQGAATALFTLTPDGGGTKVVWGFETDLGMNPVSRYFGLMFDKMIEKDYEKGLQGLKKLAESFPQIDFSDLQVEEVQVTPMTVAYVAASCSKDHQEIAKTIGASYAQVGKFMASHKLKQASAPITIDTRWDDSGYGFDAAIPVDRAPAAPIPADSPVKVKQTYSGKALKAVHTGPYVNLETTFRKLRAYAATHGYEAAAPPWDEYVSDPGNTPEVQLITHIFLPVK